MSAQIGRGPDPRIVSVELAFDDLKRLTIELLELQEKVQKVGDRWHKARARLRQVARVDADISLERELQAILAMRGGVPFWDRTPAEPEAVVTRVR